MEDKISVLFLTKYSQKGASSRYRFYNYRDYLETNGISVTFQPLFGDAYLTHLYGGNPFRKLFFSIIFILKRFFFLFFSAHRYHHVVIEAEIFPHFPSFIDFFFLKKMKSYSLDFDDNISANYAGTSMSTKIPALISAANFVTVGNHWYLSEYKGNLVYLPTVINLDAYPLYTKSKENEVPIIVWIGSPSTVKYLKLIEPVLVDLSDKFDFELKIIGANIAMDTRIKTSFVSWSAPTENLELAKSDIGIMPLENTFWEKGKCGFKLIQYMASGLPVVGSGLPANKEIVEHKISGYIADSVEEWTTYLTLLLEDRQLRSRMGENGRKRVENNYSYQVWGVQFADIIKSKYGKK